MDLPQELIDAIVDAVVGHADLVEDPWIVHKVPDAYETLRACAVVAHAFVRPCQTYIFHGITLYDEAHCAPPRLSTLFVQSPHLAKHVRALHFASSTWEADEYLEPIIHILASVTKLERLYIHPAFDRPLHPGPVRDIFLLAFTLPYLHHLSLWYIHFEDASELHACLAACTGLKTLVLRSIEFDDAPIESDNDPVESNDPHTQQASKPPGLRIMLESLQLFDLNATQVQALLSAFTVVDVTRLRVLRLHNTPMGALLRVNGPTIQRLIIHTYSTAALLAQGIGQDALIGAHNLQALELTVPFLLELTAVLRRLGGLRQLRSLRTVSVQVSHTTEPAEWQPLDALLDEAPALAEVYVYSGSRDDIDEPQPQPELWMPSLAGRGVLHIQESV